MSPPNACFQNARFCNGYAAFDAISLPSTREDRDTPNALEKLLQEAPLKEFLRTLDDIARDLAQNVELRQRMGTGAPSLWSPLQKLWVEVIDAQLIATHEEEGDESEGEEEQDGTKVHEDVGDEPSSPVAHEPSEVEQEMEDIRTLTYSLARLTRNLVAGVHPNQRECFVNEPAIRQLLHYHTSWTANDDEKSHVLTRMLTQTLSNTVTTNDPLMQRLWETYMDLPEEQVILIRLLASPDPRTVLSVLVLMGNCLHGSRARTKLLTTTKIGSKICIALLDKMVTLYDAEENTDGAKAFDVGYDIFTRIVEGGLIPDLYAKLTMEGEVVTPHQTTLLKLLDSYLQSHPVLSPISKSSPSSRSTSPSSRQLPLPPSPPKAQTSHVPTPIVIPEIPAPVPGGRQLPPTPLTSSSAGSTSSTPLATPTSALPSGSFAHMAGFPLGASPTNLTASMLPPVPGMLQVPNGQSSGPTKLHMQLSPMLSSCFFTLSAYAQNALRKAMGLAAHTFQTGQGNGDAPAVELNVMLPKVCEALVLVTQCVVTITLENENASLEALASYDNVKMRFNSVESEGEGIVESLIGLLRLLDMFLPRIVHGKAVPPPAWQGGGSAVSASAITFPESSDPAGFSYLKRDLVRLLGILAHGSKSVQNRVRDCGGIPAVMNLCVVDERNPYLREHAIFTLHNLLQGNPENQALVDDIKPVGNWDEAGVLRDSLPTQP